MRGVSCFCWPGVLSYSWPEIPESSGERHVRVPGVPAAGGAAGTHRRPGGGPELTPGRPGPRCAASDRTGRLFTGHPRFLPATNAARDFWRAAMRSRRPRGARATASDEPVCRTSRRCHTGRLGGRASRRRSQWRRGPQVTGWEG